ncbi:hypothetical protein EKD02_02440 [Chlorobium phaeovibrioides]|uniref:DUF4142 domain-containing protein n=1 Tax=Chlorobium phaeovibrioides TaxID=1094 RepID=A0A432AXF6_CHLPH|nr:hypothetical protein [Chlorobium phaeovibrioides]RTY39551.1 hypothetical protein EKD02_02440 [Chlorobium phaeovibrioides]
MMKSTLFAIPMLAASLTIGTGMSSAAEGAAPAKAPAGAAVQQKGMAPEAAHQAPAAVKAAKPAAEAVYGSELMSKEEIADYKVQLKACKNPEARTKLQMEHHTRMQERAAEKGVTLPD